MSTKQVAGLAADAPFQALRPAPVDLAPGGGQLPH